MGPLLMCSVIFQWPSMSVLHDSGGTDTKTNKKGQILVYKIFYKICASIIFATVKPAKGKSKVTPIQGVEQWL